MGEIKDRQETSAPEFAYGDAEGLHMINNAAGYQGGASALGDFVVEFFSREEIKPKGVNVRAFIEGGANMPESGNQMYDFIRSELSDKLLAQEKLTEAKVQRIEQSAAHMKDSNALLVEGLREVVEHHATLVDEKIDRISQTVEETKKASEDVKKTNKMLAWTVGLSVAAMLITLIIGGTQIFVAILGLAK